MRREFFIHRCFLHVLNFGLQTGNLAGLHDVLGSIETSDLQLKKLLAMKFRYFTTWVVMLHIFYSASALVVLYRQNERFKKGKTAPIVILKPKLKFSLEGIFRGILWPSSLVVTIFFWTLFNYDRDLIFPKFFDEVICSGSNHIIHTWITIFVFLEVLFNPRLRPVNHTKYLRVMFIFLAVYLSVFYYTLLTEDIWLYPIFSVAYNGGIMYFLLLHLMLLVLFLISYVLLWKVNDRFHEHRQFLMKKTRFFSIRWGTPAIKE